jgi:hypothetical protein
MELLGDNVEKMFYAFILHKHFLSKNLKNTSNKSKIR